MGQCDRYRAFIMDKMKGQQTSAQEGRNTFQVWSQAFQQESLISSETGCGFIPGLAAPLACITRVRQLMQELVDGVPMLLFCADDTVATQKEIKKYWKKVLLINGSRTIVDEPANPRKFDCMAALQYGVADILPRLQARNAFIMDEPMPVKSMIPNWLEEALNESRNTSKQIHLGPGTVS